MFVSDIPQAARTKLSLIKASDEVIMAARLLTSGPDILLVRDGDGILCGVVTRTDIVRRMSICQGAACRGLVSSIMSRDVMRCREEDSLHDLSLRMKAGHIKNIPLVDDIDRPIGLLTARAILRTLLGEAEEAEAQMVGYVSGIGYR